MRLIDADELERRIREAEKIFYDIEDVGIAIDCIDATKTISEWHYPSRGEYPTEDGKYLCCHKYNDNLIPTIGIYNKHHKLWCGESGIAWNRDPVAWQQIVPPKEEA